MQSSKYLAVTMELWLPKLEAFGALRNVRFSPEVRDQLMAVSGATIDRLLPAHPGGDGAKRPVRHEGRQRAVLDH